MKQERATWFAVSSPETNLLHCVACGEEIEIAPRADHHPGVCPRCGVESAFLNWNGRIIQVVPKKAPASFAAVLHWMQEHLDELEYVELLCALEEIASVLDAAGAQVALPR